jgi:hypothetical protein
MSQQPQSAKRVRSNTSNEVTPQTAPGLRGRPPPPHTHNSHNTTSIGLYAPTGYNGTYGAIPGGRQDIGGYGSYTATNQPNGYLQAPFAESYDPPGQSNSYVAPYGQPGEHITNPGGIYTQDNASNARNGVYTSQVALRQAVSVDAEAYSPSALGNGHSPTYAAVQGQAAATPPRQNLQQQYGEMHYTSSYSLTHNPAYHSQTTSYSEPTVDHQYSPSISRTNTIGNDQSPESQSEDFDEEHGSDEDAQGETADEAEISEVSCLSWCDILRVGF